MFKQQYNIYVDLVENYLNKLPLDEQVLCQSMRYSIAVGGKRIRPVLSLATAEIFNVKVEDILPVASAIELIHTYSLIHDDLPAMDDDDFRRGKLSNHKVYGEAYAILAGDALLTFAFDLLTYSTPFIPCERQICVIKEVAEAAGYRGMVGGQAFDIDAEGKKLTLEEIEAIHRLKTGALLKVSVRSAAILAGASKEELKHLTMYAQAIGLAFQIKDDILDIEGDSITLGKPIGSDEKHNKSTYPALLGLDGAKNHLRNQIELALESLKPFGERAQFLVELAHYIAERKK